MIEKEIPKKYRFLPSSKWTAVQPFFGWKHYFVIDTNFEEKPFKAQIQAACDEKIVKWVEVEELYNKEKWLPGWKRIVQNENE